MASYKTKQRTILLDFLAGHPHESFSSREIFSKFSAEISLSAVYRNLAELEKSNEITKISKNGTREVFYRYARAKVCENHMHLYCKVCKTALHVSHNISSTLSAVLMHANGFSVDMSDSILYGVCKNCTTNK